ncbi:Zn-ribbon domain-containing OB-fold protein [Rhodococcus sp. NPDC127530]|uniref:Zn-ribbon domain-containing OB-fold protein n=1 Tax=unclassified Rhodococcus (in: high G+C Gram-positive bacteria) TaxID=192944 RepID=UPI00362FEF3C
MSQDTTEDDVTTQAALPVPDLDELEQHFFDALRAGELVFQKSAVNAWMPPRTEDPVSLSPDWEWVAASGSARLVSWVTYHIAYHPYFEDKLPYQVAVIELDEGPRMIAPLDLRGSDPIVDMPMQLDIRTADGWPLPVFVPAEDDAQKKDGTS